MPCYFNFSDFNSNMVRLKVTCLLRLSRCNLNFNSNMVRLKAEYDQSNKFYYHKFQFQYGSIKRRDRIISCVIIIRYFNSNMVRLKETLRAQVRNYIRKFQFQYGSIKSDLPFKIKQMQLKFQFQYGSIKRIERSKRKQLSKCYFNSNMVRLKDSVQLLSR